jgi:hypothetical protein
MRAECPLENSLSPVSMKMAKSVLCARPEVSVTVLQNRVDGWPKQPFFSAPDTVEVALGSRPSPRVAPTERHEKETTKMFCKHRITLIGHLGKDTETRFYNQRNGLLPLLDRD